MENKNVFRMNMFTRTGTTGNRFSHVLIGSLILLLALSVFFTGSVSAQTGYDMEVTSKTINDTSLIGGQTVTYTVLVKNNSGKDVVSTIVTDNLPAGLTFVSATASQGTYNAGTGIWTIGTFLKDTSRSLTITATVNAGLPAQIITNTATISASGNVDPTPANNSKSVSAIVNGADLQVSKTVDITQPLSGQSVIFTVGVTNLGPDPATGVRVKDELNFRLRFSSATASQGNYNNTSGIWTVGNLAAGASATLSIRATVLEGVSITNQALIEHSDQLDPNTQNNQATLTLAGSKIFSAGACVVDMGLTTQAAGLKPYGLIYDLVTNYQIPVYWSINPAKVKDGNDFSIGINNYRGGPFIIPAEWVSTVQTAITLWRTRGAVIDCSQPEFTAPIYDYISSFPNSVLDEQNGSIAADAFYTPAQIPATAYREGGPEDLVDCDDVYVMPHADPADWPTATKAIFEQFILNGGSLYGACHAVSSLEAPGYGNWPFLSQTGLIPWGDHGDASGNEPYPYDPDSANDPIMQYIGHVEGALVNGSEQIYLPILNGGWRSTTTVAVWDPNQEDVLDGLSPGKAALVAYGRAYGNPDYGMILYQASHTFQGGTVAENTAAARTIGNLLLSVGIEERPQIISSIPDYVEAGLTESMSAIVSGGTSPYTYSWTSTCGGTFSNPNAASTTFTAPIVTSSTACVIRLVATDQCNRINFQTKSITINGATGLEIDKSVSPENITEGDLVTYTITPDYSGSLGLTSAVVTDVVPTDLDFISANAGGSYAAGNRTITWNLGNNTAGVVGSVVGNPVGAGTETIYPSGDTWIDQNKQTDVNGGDDTLIANNKAGQLSYPLVQFPLTTIPSGATINSATLNLYLEKAQNNNTSTVFRMITPWTEAGASYGDSDGAGTGDWQTAGVFGTSDYAGSTSYGTITNTPTGLKSINASSLVSGWVNGTWTNNGVVLVPGGTGNNSAEFSSREATGTILDPYLRVEWNLPAKTGSLVAIRPETFVVIENGQINVQMKVTTSYNTVDVLVTPPAALTVSGSVSATKVSGPLPATAIIPNGGGSVTFTYVYSVTAGTTPQNVTFSGVPTSSTPGVTFATGTSKAVIVSPVLRFQARLKSPLAFGVTTVNNTAVICDALVFAAPNCKQDSASIMTFPLRGSIGDHIWLDENGDGVQDAGESGIANVQMLATWYGSDGVPGGGDDVIYATWTDTNGNYIFKDLPAGNYSIAVNTGTLADGLETNPTYDYDGTGTANTAAVTLTSGQDFDGGDFGYNWSPTSDVTGNTGLGALGDRIWADVDGDGIQDPNEPGIAGITVTLYIDDNGDGVFDTPYGTTTTGPDGTYIFDNLPANAYVIEVTPPSGYTPISDPDGTLDNKTTSPIMLAPGDVFVNADFGYLPNPGISASIGNSIWRDINGDGVLDAGEPGIPGVTIGLIQDSNGNGIWDAGEPIIASTISDSSGNYTFDGVPVGGDYLVWVNDTSNILDGLEPTYDADGTATPNISAVTNLPAAGSFDQDFGYASPSQVDYNGVIASTVWYDADGNGTQDPTEVGIPGVDVNLTWYGLDGVPGGGDDVVYTTTTDANGNYSFGDLPAGNYRVLIPPSNFPTGMPLDGLSNSGDPDGGLDNSSLVTLPTNGSANFDQDFGYTGPDPLPNSVISNIFIDLNRDGSQNANESGIPDVVVQLTWYGPDGVPGGGDDLIYTTVTDANGTYEFDNLPDGYYSVTSDLPPNTGPGGVVEGWTPTDPGNDATGKFSLDPEGNYATPAIEDNQNIGYTPSDGAGDEGFISSTVWFDSNGDGLQDPNEVGIPGVLVTLTDGINTWTTLTDASGNYVFADLPAGTFTATVAASNFTTGGPLSGLTNTFDADGGLNSTSIFTLVDNQSVNVNQDFGYTGVDPLPNSASSVVFIDANGDGLQDPGDPGIPGVVVQLTWYGPDGVPGGDDVVYNTITDANGNYTFPDLPDGNFAITTDLPSNTGPGGPLEGLTPTDIGGDRSSIFSLDPTHAFSVGVADNSQLFGNNPSEPLTDIGVIGDTIYLDRDGNGTADPGEGLEGVQVDLYASDGMTLLATRYTDANGNYSFGGLAEDTYVVKVVTSTLPNSGTGLTNSFDPDGGGNSMSTLTITAADPVRLDQDFAYTATTPNSISGTVWTDSNADGFQNPEETVGLAGVTIVLRNAAGNIVAKTVTDPSGNYTFSGLPDGDYTVDVTDDSNILNGYWHSLGTPDTDGHSQSDPKAVSLSGGQSVEVDFGYYLDPAALGSLIWVDVNSDGIQDPGEGGLQGAIIKLTITYPNGTVTEVITVSGPDGYYKFDNLLLDENYDGVGTTGEPTYTLSVTPPASNPVATIAGAGSDRSVDSGLASGETVTTVRGTYSDIFDFGFLISPTAIYLPSDPVGMVNDQIHVTWETFNESDILGFTIYRETLGTGVIVMLQDVDAEYPGTKLGGTYEFIDETAIPGEVYYYYLDVHTSDGNTTRLGPTAGMFLGGAKIYMPIITR